MVSADWLAVGAAAAANPREGTDLGRMRLCTKRRIIQDYGQQSCEVRKIIIGLYFYVQKVSWCGVDCKLKSGRKYPHFSMGRKHFASGEGSGPLPKKRLLLGGSSPHPPRSEMLPPPGPSAFAYLYLTSHIFLSTSFSRAARSIKGRRTSALKSPKANCSNLQASALRVRRPEDLSVDLPGSSGSRSLDYTRAF